MNEQPGDSASPLQAYQSGFPDPSLFSKVNMATLCLLLFLKVAMKSYRAPAMHSCDQISSNLIIIKEEWFYGALLNVFGGLENVQCSAKLLKVHKNRFGTTAMITAKKKKKNRFVQLKPFLFGYSCRSTHQPSSEINKQSQKSSINLTRFVI